MFSARARLGAILDEQSIAALRVPIVAGGANNQLATPEDGPRVHARGILYAPDYVINAGGIINVCIEYLRNGDASVVREKIEGIPDRLEQIWAESAAPVAIRRRSPTRWPSASSAGVTRSARASFANPARFLKLARPATGWLLAIGLILTTIGVVGGLTLTPPDYLQGESVRIMYVHVPAAWLGMAGWAGIAAA